MAVDPIIKQKAEDIRHKIYGKEVRESLASGIEAMSEDVVSVTGRQATVEEQFQAVIDETTGKDVISAPEIILARGEATTLGERLDSEKAEVSAQLAHMVTIDFVKDCGGIGDGQFNNYYAFIKLAKMVNDLKEKVRVNFPVGLYKYKPLLPLADSWRDLTEIVDAKDVYYSGYGAIIQQEKDSTWTAGYTESGMREQESPIQFRSTTEGASDTIIIEGLKVYGDRVPYVSAKGGDGNCIGVCFRGVEKIVLRDVEANNWGTDGIVLGRAYENGHKSKNAFLFHVLCDNNTRQGASVTGCDDVVIDVSTFRNTHGGSFGHGLDLETNVGSQRNIKVINSNFFNNERGAFNAIGTTDVILENCFIEELISDGAFYADGNSLPTKNVRIKNCTIIALRAVLYLQGTNVKDFIFEGCDITTRDKPNNNATVRINAENRPEQLDKIGFKNCKFNGTGGILTNLSTGEFIFEDNEMNISKMDSTNPDVVDFAMRGKTKFKRNDISIDTSVVSTSKIFTISEGDIDGNKFYSHSNAIFRLRDDRVASILKVVIGKNVFSDYFYYQGEHPQLDVKTEGVITETNLFGRLVHGGYRRTISGVNAKVGDIVFSPEAPTGSGVFYRCTEAGSPGVWKAILLSQ